MKTIQISGVVSALVMLLALLTLSGCFRLQERHPDVVISPVKASVRLGRWVLIDSGSEQLTVYQDDRPEVVFDNIAFGAAGVGTKSRRGDDVTPRGVFTIGWLTLQSKFVHFIGLNYPRVEDAEVGLRSGIIDISAYRRIVAAHSSGKTPPQDTRLGGLIGIHGVGRGDIEIHRLANWTAGCVAVENEQIRQLAKLIGVGTLVEIR